MFEKICFLFEIPPVKSYYSRYDMGYFIDKGFKIIVLDLSPMINPGFLEKASIDSLLAEGNELEVYHIKTIKEYRNIIENISNTFFWSTIPFFSKSFKAIKMVSRYSYGFICNVDYVPAMFDNNLIKENKRYYTDWSVDRIKNALLARLPKYFFSIREADAVVIYSDEIRENLLKNTTWGKNTIVELTNTIDYLECIKSLKNSKQKIINGKYCVFLDQYLPYHPEALSGNLDINPEIYYREINSFLKKVAEYLQIKVIIAAHPKADYGKHSECFPEFEVIQFHTAELVKDAEIVFSHYSLSLNYTFFFRKPYLLITLDEIEKNEILANNNETVSKLLGHRCYNISSDNIEIEQIIKEEIESNIERSDSHIARVRLPDNHQNSTLQFGEVLMKAMSALC